MKKYEVRVTIYDPVTLEPHDTLYADDMDEARETARQYKLVRIDRVWYNKDGGRTVKTVVELGEQP